jgi:hypothetical protein
MSKTLASSPWIYRFSSALVLAAAFAVGRPEVASARTLEEFCTGGKVNGVKKCCSCETAGTEVLNCSLISQDGWQNCVAGEPPIGYCGDNCTIAD